jgi:hypothetical protein
LTTKATIANNVREAQELIQKWRSPPVRLARVSL